LNGSGGERGPGVAATKEGVGEAKTPEIPRRTGKERAEKEVGGAISDDLEPFRGNDWPGSFAGASVPPPIKGVPAPVAVGVLQGVCRRGEFHRPSACAGVLSDGANDDVRPPGEPGPPREGGTPGVSGGCRLGVRIPEATAGPMVEPKEGVARPLGPIRGKGPASAREITATGRQAERKR